MLLAALAAVIGIGVALTLSLSDDDPTPNSGRYIEGVVGRPSIILITPDGVRHAAGDPRARRSATAY